MQDKEMFNNLLHLILTILIIYIFILWDIENATHGWMDG